MATRITEELQLILKANYDGAKQALEKYEELINDAEKATDDLAEAQRKCSEASDAAEESEKKLGGSTGKTTGAQNEQAISLGNLIAKYTSFIAVGALALKTFKAIMEAGEQANIANARAAAMIEAAGRSSDITMSSLKRMATQLMKETGFSTTEITNASARMLTALDTDSERLRQYMSLAADLAALWGTDLAGSAKTLAEILAEPAEGISKLKKQGIYLDEALVSNITHLEQMGNTAAAQALIVKALSERIGETAESIKSAKSSLTQLKEAWEETLSYMGEKAAGSDFGRWLTDGLIEGLDRQKALDYMTGFLSDLKTDSAKALAGLSGSDIDFIEAFLGDIDELSTPDRRKIYNKLGVRNQDQYAAAAANVTALLENQRSRIEAAAEAQQILNEKQCKAAKIAEARKKIEQDEIERTKELSALYATTAEGQLASMEAQLSLLRQQKAEDEDTVSAGKGKYTKDQIEQAAERLKMYDAIIDPLQGKIDMLKDTGDEAVQSVLQRVLGKASAEDYALDIPIGIVWAAKPEDKKLMTLQAQLAAVKSAADALHAAGPDEGDTGQWQAALDILIAKHGEISGEIEGITEKAKLRNRAEALLESLLTDEEKKEKQLLELQALQNEGLLTETQHRQLKANLLGKELTDQEKISDILKEQSKGLVSVNSIAQEASRTFAAMGNAIASGADAGDAALDSIGSYVTSLASQISTSSIAAGMRIIAETGWAGVPTALALFALGGVAGIGAGLMGGGRGLDSEITESMEKELKAREALAEQINGSIDEEYMLLKRQLERNMISVEDFRNQSSDIQGKRDFNTAISEASRAAMAKVRELDSELSSMSGWHRWWTSDDEDIEEHVSRIRAIYDEIDNDISRERLAQIISQLKALGVDTSGIPRFATGGSFMTNGPQLILVGDNPSGRELVDIRPVGSGEAAAVGQSISIRIDTAYGIEDLYGKLELAAAKMGRRRA
ncbi:MAG: phage tail length tape measure family protein [Sphaerochaetaceae bacterium]